MNNDEIPTNSTDQKRESKLGVRALLVLILLMQAITLGYDVYKGVLEQNIAEQRAAYLDELTFLAAEMAITMIDVRLQYIDAAYGNAQIDRISEQQLLASEAQLDANNVLSTQIMVLTRIVAVLGGGPVPTPVNP